MDAIYLVHAKSQKAKDYLLERDAIQFSEDTFFYTKDVLSVQRFTLPEPFLNNDDCLVFPIFLPNKPHDLSGNHCEEKRLRTLFNDLWNTAYHWPK